MTALPGVSIVIPNYNYARFVGAAIESALAQDHSETEVIVVDDGSTDGSRAVIASFDDRIRAVYQANGGHVAASNAGWALARHDIVIFLDADDLLMPDAASTVAAAWQPGVSKVQWTLEIVDHAGRPAGSTFPKYPRSLAPDSVREALLATGGYPCPPTSGNAYARWFLEALAPIEGHRWMDPLLISAAPLHGEVITINRALGAYRSHDANGTEHATVSVSRFQRYVADETARIRYLEQHCLKLGVTFDALAATARNVAYLEARLMAAKLDRRNSLAAGWIAITAVLGSAQSPSQRAIRAFWVLSVVALPLPLARQLIAIRYIPVRRPRIIETTTRAFEPRRSARSPATLTGDHVSVAGSVRQTGGRAS